MSLYRWTVERSTSIYKLVGRVLSAGQVTSQIKADLYTDRQRILTVCHHPPHHYCLYMGLKNSRQAYQVHYAKKVICECGKSSVTKAQKQSTKTRMCYRLMSTQTHMTITWKEKQTVSRRTLCISYQVLQTTWVCVLITFILRYSSALPYVCYNNFSGC